ncbi:MAG: hypothetical protein IJ863_08655 [Spirochaetales bacterium]|nr:hypothetical protein [Spirochaetales bacterium]
MQSLFSYSKSNSPIHRTPAGLKILALVAVPITLQLAPPYVCYVLMVLFLVLALMSGTGFRNFLRDLRPIVIYSIFILAIDVLSFLLFDRNRAIITGTSLFLVLKLVCAMEATSIFFRTTSVYQIKDTLQTVERVVTFGHTRYTVSSTFTLFLSFLPMIFETWTAIELAYRARGGRNGISKAIRLLPRLIAMSIKRASTTYLALLNRS